MDSEARLYLARAEDEFLLAKKDMQISIDQKIKEILGILKEKTFFYSVIAHAYYSIFYSAKSYLLSKGLKATPPEEHKKTYDLFSNFVKNGELDKELLIIYDNEIMKADSLLQIFKSEKKKRGMFTYNVKSEANMPYAQESVNNAEKFVSSIKKILNSD